MDTGVSIIVPFLNEGEGIHMFCEAIDKYQGTIGFDLELVFVDDGSLDDTAEIIRDYNFKNIQYIQLIKLSRNFGSHAALRAGFQYARYDVCTWMGADLQEPIKFIEMAYEKITRGYEAVYIDKRTVDTGFGERLFSKTYSWLMRKYAVNTYSSGGTSVIVFNKKIKDYMNANVEANSSVMLQILDAGFKHCTISLDFNERAKGTSKWTLKKKIKLFIDSFVAFSFMPIRLVSIIGIIIFIAGLIIGINTIINYYANPDVPMGYSTLTSLLALGFGITNISLGIIAEYLWRAYDAARQRPAYIISSITDLSSIQGAN